MKKFLGLLLALFVLFASPTKAQDKLPLKLIATTPLPDLIGDLEFFAPDFKHDRLFLCAENSKTSESGFWRFEIMQLRRWRKIAIVLRLPRFSDRTYSKPY